MNLNNLEGIPCKIRTIDLLSRVASFAIFIHRSTASQTAAMSVIIITKKKRFLKNIILRKR